MHGSDLDDVGEVGPGSVGDGVTAPDQDGKPVPHDFTLGPRGRSQLLPLNVGYLRENPLPQQGLPVEHEMVDEPQIKRVQVYVRTQLVGLGPNSIEIFLN